MKTVNAMVLNATWVLRWTVGVISARYIWFPNPPLVEEEGLIAVFSVSVSISPPLSAPLWLKLRGALAVSPPRPIHSGERHIKTACSPLTSKLHPSLLSATFHSFELKLGSPPAHVRTPKGLSASPPHASPIFPPPPQPLPRGDVITHFGGRAYP